MSQAPQFVISEFTNPSGEIVFRLTGWLDGKRIRKNFPSRAEAAVERQAMEIQQFQTQTGTCIRFAGRSGTATVSRPRSRRIALNGGRNS